MIAAQTLRKKLGGSQLVLGVLVTDHLWPGLIELSRNAGLDYVIVDAEHFDHGGQLLADACSLGRLIDFPVLLRPPSIESTVLRRAMDLGPCGLLLPMVESPEQMDAVCNSVYLPPRGQRRPGGPSIRWVRKTDYDSFRRDVEDDLIVIPQVENPRGLENAGTIAAHPLVTALGVGPFDLSARLGICGDAAHPLLQEAHQQLRRAAEAAGKPVWTIGDGATMIDRGFRFICVGEPSWLLEAALGRMVHSLRNEKR